MRRTDRLFQIIQTLRSARRPMKGQELAEELEISLRTLYRDMAELMAQRVPIRGEAGTGYVLEAGYELPPLMLTQDELEAAVLGAAWVAQRGDPALARGARDLIGKLTEAAPAELRPILLDAALKPLTFRPQQIERFDMGLIRAAIRERRKLRVSYADAEGRASERVIWPILLAYTDHLRLIAAWCELRGDFRHFRADRIVSAQLLDARHGERMASLRKRWRDQESMRKRRD